MPADLVSLHAKRLREALSPLRGQAVALVGFVESPNISNHAMWLGEKRLLTELGARVVYECSAQSYDREIMAGKLGNGVILLHGGSPSGRSAAQRGFRWRVLEEFPGARAILMPQQPAPEDDEVLKRAGAAAGKGRELTLFATSDAACAVLSRHFGASAKIELAPDTAFMLGVRKRMAELAYEIVWIARTDDPANDQTEAAARLASQAAEKFPIPNQTDGIEIGLVGKHRPQTVLLTDWQAFVFENEAARMGLRRLDFDSWAQVYVTRALTVLSQGQVVITDRLHAHILSLLLDIPNILLNDSAGRNFAFRESWTKTNARCQVAQNPPEAWAMARHAAARLKDMPPAETARWTWRDIAGLT